LWNYFIINFNIYYPLRNPNQYIQIVDSIGLGNWLREGEKLIKMQVSEVKEIIDKYGNIIKDRFWNVTVPMKITDIVNYDFNIDILFIILKKKMLFGKGKLIDI